jgi:O-antigen/teichoic acid export membrane protein
MGALSVMNMLLIQFDRVVVSKLLPIASVGYYSFASTVVVRISFAAGSIAQAALPSFSSLHSRGESGSLIGQYRKLQDLVSYGMVLPFTAACFGAVPLYEYLFNHQVAALLLLPTALLCLGFYLGATVNIPYTFAVAMGRPEIASRTNMLALFVVIPVATTMIYLFGLAGAATSWVVYNLFVYAYMIPRICRECLRVSIWTWYAQIGKVLALAAATYGSMWLLVVLPNSYSATGLAIAYVIATAAFLGGTLMLIGPDLRETVWRLLRPIMVGKARSLL